MSSAPQHESPETGPQHRHSWRKLLQFRLASVLILTTVCCGLMGVRQAVRKPYQKQQDAVQALVALGGEVKQQGIKPKWLAKFFGEDVYQRVATIDLHNDDASDDDLACLVHVLTCDRLYLAGNPITDQTLANIRHLKDLRRLSLWSTNITDGGLAHLELMRGLQAIDLYRTRVGDEGLKYLCDKSDLRFLGLSRWMSDEGMQHLAGLTKLRRIDVNSAMISGAGYARLSGTRLHTIHKHSSFLFAEDLPGLVQLRYLEDLPFDLNGLTDQDVEAISRLTRLKSLRIRGDRVTDDSVPWLLAMKNLESLDIRRTRISAGELQRIRSVMQDRNVKADIRSSSTGKVRETSYSLLRNRKGDPTDSMVIAGDHTKANLSGMSDFPNVESLYIDRFQCDEELFLHVAQLEQLGFLKFDECDIAGPGIGQLSKLPQLARIQLYHTHVDQAAMNRLSELPHLDKLIIARCKLPDDAFARLGNSRSLKVLDLSYNYSIPRPLNDRHVADLGSLTGLRVLDLGYTDFRDQDCRNLQSLAELEDLCLRGTLVTDDCIDSLLKLSRLVKIDVRATRISAAGGKRLADRINHVLK